MSRCAAATSWRSGAKPPECLPMLDRLYTDLADGTFRIVKLAAPQREALRAACAADADIWGIYSSSFDPEPLDKSRWEEQTNEPQPLMRTLYARPCLKKKQTNNTTRHDTLTTNP